MDIIDELNVIRDVEPDALEQRTANEIILLREVYESSRQVFRFNGIDKDRTLKAVARLKNAIDAVKLMDSGLIDDDA